MKTRFKIIIAIILIMLAALVVIHFVHKKSHDIFIQQVDNVDVYCNISQALKGEEVKLQYENLEVGYEFSYFILNGEKLDGNTFNMPNSDVIVSAFVSKIQYTITYHLDENVTFQNNEEPPITYTIGSFMEIPNAYKKGAFFVGWYMNENFDSKYKIDNIIPEMYGNIELYAKFDFIPYSIVYHNISNAVNDNPTSYDQITETITLKSPTKQGYEFKGWYDNPKFIGTEITTISKGSMGKINLYAKFVSNEVDSDGYRLITNAVDFMEIIPDNLSGKYKIKGIIDFAGYDYKPIGDKNNPFTGELIYGEGYLSNITITSINEYAGLFGYMKDATIKGISIRDVDIKITAGIVNDEYIGVLSGFADNCIIGNVEIVYASIDAVVWNSYIGSLIGYAKNSTITECDISYSPIKVLTALKVYAGGLVGKALNTTISKNSVEYKESTNINISTQFGDIYYGGLVGECSESGVDNSYVWQENSKIQTKLLELVTVATKSHVGGLVGHLTISSSISNSYALLETINSYNDDSSGDLYDDRMYIGGLIGKISINSSILNSFITTNKNASTNYIDLYCQVLSENYKGSIFGYTDQSQGIVIENNYVDSDITFVNGTNRFVDNSYISINTLNVIKQSINWDETIWKDFYGVNIAPILK